jgi:cytochrome c biogenesis protein CcmG/thiol:disulfide interchange protein DsbE
MIMAALTLGPVRSEAVEIGGEAPGFTLNDPDGKAVSLSDFKGKVIILDFFATWCPPCREEIPDFIKLSDAYAPKGFAMIGVSLVTAGETKEFAEKVKFNYPVVIDDGKVSNTYGPIRSIPTTFVIDKDMKIVKMYIGFRDKEVFERDIQALLK